MHDSSTSLSPDVARGLALFFFCTGLMNLIYTWYDYRAGRSRIVSALWAIFTVWLFGTAADYMFNDHPMILGQAFRDFVDWALGPVVYFVVSCIVFWALFQYRQIVTQNWFGWIILNLTLVFTGFSMTDPDFRNIVAKADNVPISMLILSVGYFTWLSLQKAVINDERIARGEKVVEAEENEKVLTWPDLVYTEMLCMIICTVFLIVWSIQLEAPLEPPASTTKIPNPSKAPWYFLGLQEMLVYFDPWLAGVVLPTYIIIGLCAIPYIDYNKKGNGYYTFNERPFAILTFMFGFVVLWVTLIVLGTFLRGPNWNFYGPYEYWSPYKTLPLNNVNLSDMFWIDLLGRPPAKFWLVRELPGIFIILGYFLLPPLFFARMTPVMFNKMGLIRYMTMMNILLMMAFLPVKMILRWTINLKYIVYIPELFFNI